MHTYMAGETWVVEWESCIPAHGNHQLLVLNMNGIPVLNMNGISVLNMNGIPVLNMNGIPVLNMNR